MALKLLSSLPLLASLDLPRALFKRYRSLQDRAAGTLPSELECVVLAREDANEWIIRKHTGENEGVGVVGWDARARHRFLGASPALQAIDLVEKSDLLEDSTKAKTAKVAITNIERLLETPEARALLKVDIKNGKLMLNPPEDEALSRLAMVVTDVANRLVRVRQLDTKEQRIDYAREIASRPIPGKAGRRGIRPTSRPSGSRSYGNSPGHRRSLIPKYLKLRVPQTRISRILGELQKLNVNSYVNSCAVMLRVFVELSVDDFAHRRGLVLKVKAKGKKSGTTREMFLREKLRFIADFLEGKGICTKEELHGVRTLVSNRNHVISVDTLNAYVHNRHYSPTPGDLITSWDNIEPFIKRLWIP